MRFYCYLYCYCARNNHLRRRGIGETNLTYRSSGVNVPAGKAYGAFHRADVDRRRVRIVGQSQHKCQPHWNRFQLAHRAGRVAGFAHLLCAVRVVEVDKRFARIGRQRHIDRRLPRSDARADR